MKNPTVIHSLARTNEKSCKVTFQRKNGSIATFSSVINDMTGDRMTYFNNDAPTINNTKADIKKMIQQIRMDCTIIEHIGDWQ